MFPAYRSVPELIRLLDEPNRLACSTILEQNRDRFQATPGSTNNHQAWAGGYYDHVTEVMNIAVELYATLAALRPLPFPLSDLLLVVFLHDLEKPWKYERGPDGQLHHRAGLSTKAEHQRFRLAKLTEYGVVLTPEQENALRYAEGEHDDYSNRHRTMGPLAALAHMCDIASARLWFDHPAPALDPWPGAQRCRS